MGGDLPLIDKTNSKNILINKTNNIALNHDSNNLNSDTTSFLINNLSDDDEKFREVKRLQPPLAIEDDFQSTSHQNSNGIGKNYDKKSFPSEKQNGKTGKDNCSTEFASKIPDAVSEYFYRLGYHIATHPWRTITTTLIIVTIISLGMFKIHFETNPMKLWVPRGSSFRHDTEWLLKNFEEGYREQTVLVIASNVLEPKNLKKIAILNEAITKFNVTLQNGTTIGWKDVCFKLPIVVDFVDQVDPDEEQDDYDDDGDDLQLPPKIYEPVVNESMETICKIADTLKLGCYQTNMIEMWKYEVNRIENITINDVIRRINRMKISPVTGYDMDIVPLLSGIKRNDNGDIIAATSLLSHWYLHVNFSDVDHDKVGNSAGTENWASETSLAWEAKFIETIEELRKVLEDDDFHIYLSAERSFSDSISEDFFKVINKLILSAILMFIYMQFVLSKFSWIEIRIILSTFGLLCIGIAVIVTCGFCSIFGVSYSPIHSTFPLLLMGLGVDDMFVMMACWRKVHHSHYNLPIPEKIGLMMKYAGVSITITSITDLVAFIVGTTTVLPVLQSYCIYSAIGVFAIYILVITLFVAIFALDEHRILKRRNGLLPCIIHEDTDIKPHCDKNFMHRFLKFVYSKIIFTVPGKTIVLSLVIISTVLGFINMYKLEKYADNKWVLPRSSYLYHYEVQKTIRYPNDGYNAQILLGSMDFQSSMNRLAFMSERLENRTDLINSLDSWVKPFEKFVRVFYGKDIYSQNLDHDEWSMYFSKFLYSKDGGKYQRLFKFAENLKCGEKVPTINAALMRFNFVPRNGSDCFKAQHEVQNIIEDVKDGNTKMYASMWGKVFSSWSATEVTDVEMLRNIFLALICVMVCTAVLIVNFQMCFWILFCVILTLINVAGAMQSLGLKVDFLMCLSFLLAVGLCVDYAAHVGHTFLTISEGSRNERALETILHIGAAIIYGAGSTILAMVLLSISEVVTSVVFFKEVALVITFGVFYGIIALPVILSIIGPRPYHESPTTTSTSSLNSTKQSSINKQLIYENNKL